MRIHWMLAVPSLLLTASLFVTGCGQQTTTVAPEETPAVEDYEAELEESGDSSISGEAPAPAEKEPAAEEEKSE